MICALKSSLYRFVRTGLLAKFLIFSVIAGVLIVFRCSLEFLRIMPFQTPRYIDNEFVIEAVMSLLYVVPFTMAVFSTLFSGNEVSFRAVNNKIATGIPRSAIFLSDFIVTICSTLIMLCIQIGIIFAYAKNTGVKNGVRFNKQIIMITVCVALGCLAFAAFDEFIQFLCSNKIIALIILLATIPALSLGGESMAEKLNEPYRYSYVDEETGETFWKLNKSYIGGTPRKVLEFFSDGSLYSYQYIDSDDSRKDVITVSSGVFILSAAAGIATIKKKEFS